MTFTFIAAVPDDRSTAGGKHRPDSSINGEQFGEANSHQGHRRILWSKDGNHSAAGNRSAAANCTASASDDPTAEATYTANCTTAADGQPTSQNARWRRWWRAFNDSHRPNPPAQGTGCN